MKISIISEKNMGYAEFSFTYPMKRDESSFSPDCLVVAAVPAHGNSGVILPCPRIELIAVRLIFEGSYTTNTSVEDLLALPYIRKNH